MNDAPTREPAGLSWSQLWRGWFGDAVNALRDFEDGFFYKAVKVSSAYTMKRNDCFIIADTTSAGFTVTLLPASQCRRKRITIKNIGSAGNTLTIDGNGAETIDGAATKTTSTQYVSFDLAPDPATSVWHLI